MAGFEGLQVALTAMQPLQLMAAFVAAAAAALAIDTSFDARLRQGAIGTAVFAAAAFVLLAPSWLAGLFLVTLGVAGMVIFVSALRVLSRVLDIDGRAGESARERLPAAATMELRVARRTLPQRPPPAIRPI